MMGIIKDYQKLDRIVSHPANDPKHKEQIEKMLQLFMDKYYNKQPFKINAEDNIQISLELTMLLKEKLNNLQK